MSHITLANQGLQAVDNSQWEEALTKLSTALRSARNPAWLLARSKAFVGLKKFQEALEDAELAFHVAYERNARTQMIGAHYRRAVVYQQRGQFANADCCCIYAMRLCKGHPALEKEDIRAHYTDKDGFWTANLDEVKEEIRQDPINQPGFQATSQTPETAKQLRQAGQLRLMALAAMGKLNGDDPARKATVCLSPEKRAINLYEKMVNQRAPAAAGPKPAAVLDTTAKAKATVQTDDVKTASIESTKTEEKATAADTVPPLKTIVEKGKPAGESASHRAYPTSSRTGPKNWDKILADIDDAKENEGDVNHFFQQLYSGASDDAKRAMQKSFIESNGTKLSTDWNDVSQGTVQTNPPEGMEAKKW